MDFIIEGLELIKSNNLIDLLLEGVCSLVQILGRIFVSVRQIVDFWGSGGSLSAHLLVVPMGCLGPFANFS